jgi:hypothetical protein
MAAVQKVQGIVEAVSVKALAAPDRFENTHKHGLKVGDTWYDFGGSKMDAFCVKDDEGKWKQLGKGSEVLIKFEQNGNFNNSKKTWLTVLSLVEGDKPSATPQAEARRTVAVTGGASTAPITAPKAPSASQSVSGRSSRTGTDWAKKDAGAAASASVDKAIALLAAAENLSEYSFDECFARIEHVARNMQRIVLKLAEEILAGSQSKAAEPEKPKLSPKPAPKPKPPARTETQVEEELATSRTWDDDVALPF